MESVSIVSKKALIQAQIVSLKSQIKSLKENGESHSTIQVVVKELNTLMKEFKTLEETYEKNTFDHDAFQDVLIRRMIIVFFI